AARCQPARVLESLLDLVGHAVDVDHSGREPASGGGPGQPAAAIAAAEQRRSALAPGEEPGRGRSEDIEGAADEMAGLVPERPRDLAEAREHAAAALPQPRRARAAAQLEGEMRLDRILVAHTDLVVRPGCAVLGLDRAPDAGEAQTADAALEGRALPVADEDDGSASSLHHLPHRAPCDRAVARLL